jgi:DNA-binding CsgD family transcriptional regulator
MNPLRSAEVKAFSEAVETIHLESDLPHFPEHVFAIFEKLIPGAVFTLDEFNLQTGVARDSISRAPANYAAWREHLTKLVPAEHPVFPALQAAQLSGRKLGALKISDFLSLRQFRRTNIFHDIFLPIECRHSIVLPLHLPGHVAGLTISRWTDFTESESAMAGLLSPHLALAHIHAQTLTTLREIRRHCVPSPENLCFNAITRREADVLHWLIHGKRDSEIAKILGVSARTVGTHVQRILSKLHVENRTAAAMEALRLGGSAA